MTYDSVWDKTIDELFEGIDTTPKPVELIEIELPTGEKATVEKDFYDLIIEELTDGYIY